MFSTRFSTARDFNSEWYRYWKVIFGFDDRVYRKLWEVAFVCETLRENDKLQRGARGVAFGVGSEELPRKFANLGCHILATDLLAPEWAASHRLFAEVNSHERIQTQNVDMNFLQDIAIGNYDFAWSVCAMDHCGSTWLTKRFLLNQMNLLRVGGIAAHTAEYTISAGMPKEGGTVYLTAEDVLDVAHLMESMGHQLAPVDWFVGDSIEDHMIDSPPYVGHVHLKAEMCDGRWGTCVGFAARKTTSDVAWIPVDEFEGRKFIAEYQLSHSHR